MDEQQSIRLLLTSLTSEENVIIRSHLKAFSIREKDEKGLQLFELLRKMPSITEPEITYHIYGKQKSRMLSRLQLRLRDIILAELVNQHQISRDNLIKTRTHARILVRHKLNHVDVLFSRKLYPIATDVLEDIITKTEKFELLDEQLSAFTMHQDLARIQKDELKVAELTLKIFHCRQRIMVISLASQLSTLVRQSEWINIDERLTQLRESAKESPSVTCTFLVMDVEAIRMKEQCNYEAALELFQQQLTFALRHPAIKEHYLVAGIYFNLAIVSVHLRRYNKALDFLMDAVHERRINPWQEEVVCIRFHALFYIKNYEEVLRMVTNANIDGNAMLYNYWIAACYFMMKDYKNVIQCMENSSFFQLAQHECGAWPMFMLQMSMIEEGSLNNEQLKKQLVKVRERYTAELLGREEVVDGIMNQIIEYNFDFERVALNSRKAIMKLKSRNGDYSFEFFSGELVVFHTWIISKS